MGTRRESRTIALQRSQSQRQLQHVSPRSHPSAHPSVRLPPFSPPWPTPSGRFHIPHEHLLAVIDGVEMDLTPRRYETFDDLEQYCERVASAVGLACIHVWGFRGPGGVRAGPAGRHRPATDEHPPRPERRRRRRPRLSAAGRSARVRLLGEDLLAGVANDAFPST